MKVQGNKYAGEISLRFAIIYLLIAIIVVILAYFFL
jgi:hypothetical protein